MNLGEPMITGHQGILIDHQAPAQSSAGVVQSTDSSCQPLDQVDLDHPARRLRAIGPAGAAGHHPAGDRPEGDPDGCSPWVCRSGDPVDTTPDAGPDLARERAA
jgi:hypothetical protein